MIEWLRTYNTAQSIKKHITTSISKKKSIAACFYHLSFVRLTHHCIIHRKKRIHWKIESEFVDFPVT